MTLSPSHRDTPTTVFRNGRVFTSASSRAWASAVAVEAGRIVAVGDQDAVTPYLSRADEVVDLSPRSFIPHRGLP